MEKNTKKVKAFIAQRDAKTAVLNSLRKKVTENTLSDEAKADAEMLIAEKEAEIQAIKDLIAELEASEEDKSAELLAKIAELTAKVEEVENSLTRPKGFLKVKNFADSKDGINAFLRTVQNSASGTDFKENWAKVLTANGLTDADYFLPAIISDEIKDTWETVSENFLSLLDVTGLLTLKVHFESKNDRAQGHKKGKVKAEQELTFVPKEIRAQIIYKYITIDRETIEYENSSGSLVRYIAKELILRIMDEIMGAVLIGDGRAASADGKITKIESIGAASDFYSTKSTFTADANFNIETVATAVDSIEADGDIVLFMSKKTARFLRRHTYATGGSVRYFSMTELAEELGVSQIITTRKMADYDSTVDASTPVVVAFVGKAYKVVGDLTMTGFENFVLAYNKNEYLTETYVGGALAEYKSGAVISKVPAEAATGTITIVPTTAEFAADGEAKVITVTASSAYEIASKPDWLTGVIDGDEVTLTADANATGEALTGNVVFKLTAEPTVTATLTVTQLASEE